jgi:hypothetical protein
MLTHGPTSHVAAIAVVATCLLSLLLPSVALAAKCAPPGVSGVDQYTESVPGPGCNRPASGPGGGAGNGGGGGSHLPPGTSQQLASQGAAGRAVQRLVASGGQAAGSTGHQRGTGSAAASRTAGQGKPGVHVTVPPVSGRNLVSALLHPILSGSTSGGAGILLPIFLGVALALGVGTIVRRRRQVSS